MWLSGMPDFRLLRTRRSRASLARDKSIGYQTVKDEAPPHEKPDVSADPKLLSSALEKTFKDSQQFAWRNKTKNAKEQAKANFNNMLQGMAPKEFRRQLLMTKNPKIEKAMLEHLFGLEQDDFEKCLADADDNFKLLVAKAATLEQSFRLEQLKNWGIGFPKLDDVQKQLEEVLKNALVGLSAQKKSEPSGKPNLISTPEAAFAKPLVELPSEIMPGLRMLASNPAASVNFPQMLTAKTEPEAMGLVSEIVKLFEDEDAQKIQSLCTRIIQRRFCTNRLFHEDTVGTGLAGIKRHVGYEKTQLEGYGWRDPGWPAMWQHASWAPASTLSSATRVLVLHDPITGRTEIGEVKLNLSEFEQFSMEQEQAVMKAIAKGAKEISESREPKSKIEAELEKQFQEHRRLDHVLETFVRACDLKITELNQRLQIQSAS